MEAKRYNILAKKGDKAQEIFVKFMESCGHSFIAGDRNGKTINADIIEEIASCSYIPPNTLGVQHGPRLLFSKSRKLDGYTMPDELFLLSSHGKGYRFFDVKNRTKRTLKETFNKIVHYTRVEYFSGIKTFVAVVIYNGEGYDIYIKRAKSIFLENKNLKPYDDVDLDLATFVKINNFPISL